MNGQIFLVGKNAAFLRMNCANNIVQVSKYFVYQIFLCIKILLSHIHIKIIFFDVKPSVII